MRERVRMSVAHEGNSVDEETRAKIAAAIRGTSRSERTRRRMSEATAGKANPNWRGGYSRRYGKDGQWRGTLLGSATKSASSVVTMGPSTVSKCTISFQFESFVL
uniref:NUMOD3 domain-containing DNA-binding protein n=1 Tax=Halobacterium noricense TaxID=223182 RepID=UPI0038CC0C30